MSIAPLWKRREKNQSDLRIGRGAAPGGTESGFLPLLRLQGIGVIAIIAVSTAAGVLAMISMERVAFEVDEVANFDVVPLQAVAESEIASSEQLLHLLQRSTDSVKYAPIDQRLGGSIREMEDLVERALMAAPDEEEREEVEEEIGWMLEELRTLRTIERDLAAQAVSFARGASDAQWQALAKTQQESIDAYRALRIKVAEFSREAVQQADGLVEDARTLLLALMLTLGGTATTFAYLSLRLSKRLVHEVSAERVHAAQEEERRAAQERIAQNKSRFLASMNHELRTPMHAIIGYTEVLERELKGQVLVEHVSTIHQSARSLLAIIDDLLDYSQLDGGLLELQFRPFSPRDVVSQVTQLLRPGAEARGLDLDFSVAPEVPSQYVGDGHRLRQVVFNLVGNAVKFTERGTIRVRLSSRLGSDGARLVLTVRDTGIGIDRERLQAIFEPFEQVEGGLSRRFGGTGLGLAITKRLVELMGGVITADSSVGSGSVFEVTLPLAEHTPTQVSAEADVRLPAAWSWNGDPVLLVEDNVVNQRLAQLVLKQLGLQVMIASNGEEALQMVRQGTPFPRLILMDCQMPVMDGLVAARVLRSEHGERCPPIIALTANAREADREACMAAGMVDFVAKPFRVDTLAIVIARWLGAPVAETRFAPSMAPPRR